MTSTLPRSGMPEHFGIRITSADKDKLVGELDTDDRRGTLAGLNIPPEVRTTTIVSKSNILRACTPGRLTGVVAPIHVGRRTIVVQTSIYRADGKLAVMTTQTQLVLPREPAHQSETEPGYSKPGPLANT